MDENRFYSDGRVEQKEIKEMARYSYSDLKDVLKDSRGMVYLKKWRKHQVLMISLDVITQF